MATLKKLLPYQSAFLQAPLVYQNIRYFMLITGYGAGKGQPLSCKVLTPTGFKTIGSLAIGDKVISPADGKSYAIDGFYNRGYRQVNRITMSNGAITYCDNDHLWYYKHGKALFHTHNTTYLKKKGIILHKNGKSNIILPTNCPVNFTQKHDFTSFYVGLYLVFNNSNENKEQILTKIKNVLDEKKRNIGKNFLPVIFKTIETVYPELKINLIPKSLLMSSLETRQELLKGLLSVGGSFIYEENKILFTCNSKSLSNDVEFLINSLGRKTTKNQVIRDNGDIDYTIKLGIKEDDSCIVKIEECGNAECVCIHINSPDHLYITDDWIVTHNTSSLIDSLMFDVSRLQGKKDREGRKPLLMLCGVTLTFMKRTCVHDLLQALDNTRTEYKYHKDVNQIEIGDVTIVLQSLEDPTQIYGINSCIQYCDEIDELPTEVAMEAIRSLNERLRQQLIDERPPYAKWTTTSQGKKGLYRTVLQFKSSGIPYCIIRARTRDNIYLPKEYVDSMYAMYNDKEKLCFLEGQFVAVDSNMVFPDYDPARNDLKVDLWNELEDNDTVYIGQDFNTCNYNACACVIKKGCMVFIKDYIFSDIRRAPEVYRHDFPTQNLIWIPDMTFKEHFGEFSKELRMNKIRIAYRSCNPNVNDRLFATNKLLYTGRLYVCPICTEIKKSLTTHQRDPKTGKPMKGSIGAPDHASDALSYVVHYVLSWNKEFKDVYAITLGRAYQYRDDPSIKSGNILLTGSEITGKTFKHLEKK